MGRSTKMVQESSIKKYIFYLVLILICGLYLFLVLNFSDTIEFGFDQPRLANTVLDFNSQLSYLNSVNLVTGNAWGIPSWGIAQIFFYSPFFVISKDPLIVSELVAIFNLLTILGVVYLGSKYFNKTVGLIAGLLLATHPWWFIFARMIYQPTPVVFAVLVSMCFYLLTYKKPKSIWWSMLIFSWIFLIQIYVHAISFCLISFVLLSTVLRFKLLNRFLILGILFSSVLIIPYIYNFRLADYVPQKGEQSMERGRDDLQSRLKDIPKGFFSVISGGSLEYQLGGNGYKKFLSDYPTLVLLIQIVIGANILLVIYHFVALFFPTNNKFIRLSLVLWTLSPIPFLIFLQLPGVPPIPRYFLISLPALSILWGVLVSDLKNKLFIFLPIAISLVWLLLIFKYNYFIRNYDYPDGHLSVFSDTQYSFLKNSIDFILKDSIEKGYAQVVISTDENNPKEFSLDWASMYTITNVYKLNKNPDLNQPVLYYVIDYSQNKNDDRFIGLYRSGPLTVYQYVDLETYPTEFVDPQNSP